MTLSDAIHQATAWSIELAWRLLGALLVLAIGLVLAFLARAATRRFLLRRSDSRAWRIVPSYVFIGLVVLTLVLTLAAMGVAESVIGVIVTIGLAIGVIGDMFHGFRIFGGRPFVLGDMIELRGEAIAGRVMAITLSTTTLLTQDGTEISIPNRYLFEHVVSKPSLRGKVYRFELVLESISNLNAVEDELCKLIDGEFKLDSPEDRRVYLIKVENKNLTVIAEFRRSLFDAQHVVPQFLAAAKEYFERKSISVVSLAPVEPC